MIRRSLMAAAAVLVTAMPALADDAAINRLYRDMSAAYGALDIGAMERIYTTDAGYLTLGRDGTAWQAGRERILGGFRGFFEDARSRGDRLEIGFRLVNRAMQGDDAAVDIGHFRLSVIPKEGEPRTMAGTFLTMPVRQPDGRWAFAADSYGPAAPEAYEKAERVDGLPFD